MTPDTPRREVLDPAYGLPVSVCERGRAALVARLEAANQHRAAKAVAAGEGTYVPSYIALELQFAITEHEDRARAASMESGS